MTGRGRDGARGTARDPPSIRARTRPRRRAPQLACLEQRVDVPAALEALDRPLGLAAAPGPPDVVADHERASRPHEPGGLRKEARRVGRRARTTRSRRPRRRPHAGGKIAEVTLDAGHAIGQAGGLDALLRRPNLNRAQRDARAGDRQQPGQVAEARAHAATEVDDMRWLRCRASARTTSAMRSSTK